MTSPIIKSASGERAVAIADRPSEIALGANVLLERRRRVETLEAEIAERDQRIEALEKAVEDAFKEGERQGREAGWADAEDREIDRLDALKIGVANALDRINAELMSLERLSALLALQALQKVFGDATKYKEHITCALTLQLKKLKAHQRCIVSVSREDFPDGESLAALGQSLGRDDLELRALGEMDPGDCQIKFKLGAVEIGLNQQWAALKTTLEELAAPSQ